MNVEKSPKSLMQVIAESMEYDRVEHSLRRWILRQMRLGRGVSETQAAHWLLKTHGVRHPNATIDDARQLARRVMKEIRIPKLRGIPDAGGTA